MGSNGSEDEIFKESQVSRSVLVVDDSEIVLGATRAMLEEGGYRVSTHSRATGSVALILQTKPDIVLLDVNMPSLRGDMVARMSRATNQASDTVVLLHSTLSERELEDLTKESGAHGYIRKTNDTQSFLRRLRILLREARPDSESPLRNAAKSERTPVSEKKERSERVLLIDQDMMALSRLRTKLQDMGFTPSYALSFTQAKSKIASEDPDFLLIGTHMTGIETFLGSLTKGTLARCVLLRERGERALTAFRGPQLISPLSPDDLRGAIGRVMVERASTGS